MKFRVKAVDALGVNRTATVTAPNEEAALAIARSNGLFPTKVEVVRNEPERPVSTSPPVFESTESAETTPESGIFKYKMVQIPTSVTPNDARKVDTEAAAYLETTVNHYAAQGWEFCGIDSMGVNVPQGCLALFSVPQTRIYNVITFRRWIP